MLWKIKIVSSIHSFHYAPIRIKYYLGNARKYNKKCKGDSSGNRRNQTNFNQRKKHWRWKSYPTGTEKRENFLAKIYIRSSYITEQQNW